MFKRCTWIQYRRVKLKIHVFLRQLKSPINLPGGRFYTNNIKEWLIFHYTTYLTYRDQNDRCKNYQDQDFYHAMKTRYNRCKSILNVLRMYWNILKQMNHFFIVLFFSIIEEKKKLKWIFKIMSLCPCLLTNTVYYSNIYCETRILE